MNLYDVTGAMGEALKAAEANGVPIEDPNVFRYIDALREALKKLPPSPVFDTALKLVKSVRKDDRGELIGQVYVGGNGGMLTNETLAIADNLEREVLASSP